MTSVTTKAGAAYSTGGADVPAPKARRCSSTIPQFNKVTGNRSLKTRHRHAPHRRFGRQRIYGNAFIGNRVQVKYVATRHQEWSQRGRGNYWSDYIGWDLDSDGVGDHPYEPNDAVDKLLWKYPIARVLMNSPAVETLRWVQQQFPVLRPQGVRDSYPLMQLPRWQEARR